MRYETVIGLEIHAELSTDTKLFCGCATSFGSEPNTHTCPVCLGMPGALPVLNKKAVEYTIMAGLAMNCSITERGRQDRKNYFYPDLPKAYQISQLDAPLCVGGYVKINESGETKKIRLNRIHLEEDAGKLSHNGGETLVDLNRGGTPLIEIVTEPDLRNASEAKIFLDSVKAILEYIGVCDCKMEQGSLRCDVNISVRPENVQEFGTRTEMKNLNSFKAVTRAIEYESKRQIEELECGNTIVQQTRKWDDEKGISFLLRNKEDSQDYRYFPDPDLVQIVVSKPMLESIKKSIPELPEKRRGRYVAEYEITIYDAWHITASKALADFFEDCVKCGAPAKVVSNWLLGDITKIINEKKMSCDEIPFTPKQLSELILIVENDTISNTTGKTVLAELFENPQSPKKIVDDRGLIQISDEGLLLKMIYEVINSNPQLVNDYIAGKQKVLDFLVGQVMRAAKGHGNPKLINSLLRQELTKMMK